MEDFYEIQFTVVEETTVGLFGVFDGKHTRISTLFVIFALSFLDCLLLYIGHGGSGTASFLQKNLFKSLIMHPKFTTDKRTAIGAYTILCWILCHFLD